MKHFLLGAVAVCMLAACKLSDKNKDNQPAAVVMKGGEVEISGNIKGIDSGWLEMVYVAGEAEKTDSLKVTGGKFSSKATIGEPAHFLLRLPQSDGEAVMFFADPGKVNVEGSIDSLWAAKVNGGPSQELFRQAVDSLNAISKKGESLRQRYDMAQQTGNQLEMNKIIAESEQIQAESQIYAQNFSLRNKNTTVAAFIAATVLSGDGQEAALKKVYETLDEPVKKSFFGKKIGTLVQAADATAVGATAPGFTQPDVNGKPVSLSSFRGKYVLIDFWASWCGPCRQENPNVVKVYNEFKQKGFDVLGVSLDRSKADWLEAIAKDKLTWTHVSDLKFWESAVAAQYGVRSIPMNFLLDKDGKIIAKNLRGDELEKKLAEVLQ